MINAGVEAAIAQSIERHRKVGEAIAVWQDGEVVVLTADQIPPLQMPLASSKELLN
jgi:uncharacterized protein (DUF2249 family)